MKFSKLAFRSAAVHCFHISFSNVINSFRIDELFLLGTLFRIQVWIAPDANGQVFSRLLLLSKWEISLHGPSVLSNECHVDTCEKRQLSKRPLSCIHECGLVIAICQWVFVTGMQRVRYSPILLFQQHSESFSSQAPVCSACFAPCLKTVTPGGRKRGFIPGARGIHYTSFNGSHLPA